MSDFAKLTDTAKAESKTNMTAAAIAEHNYRGLFADFNSQREWLVNAITEHTAQAVQREREAAKGLVAVINEIAEQPLPAEARAKSAQLVERLANFEHAYQTIILICRAARATYNDNRKG
jgi:GAF domain-containing protein